MSYSTSISAACGAEVKAIDPNTLSSIEPLFYNDPVKLNCTLNNISLRHSFMVAQLIKLSQDLNPSSSAVTCLLKIPNSNQVECRFKYYIIPDYKCILGEGSSGIVVIGYPINISSSSSSSSSSYQMGGKREYRIDWSKKLAIKIGISRDAIKQTEFDIMRSLRLIDVVYFGQVKCKQLITTWDVCIMEYFQYIKLPSLATLGDSSEKMKPILIRLQHIMSLCTQLEMLHRQHSTAHGDIKPGNTIVFTRDTFDRFGRGSDVMLLDYGNSQRIPAEGGDNTLIPFPHSGNERYFAPECCIRRVVAENPRGFGRICLKTDIYMLVGVIAKMLGENKYHKDRDQKIADAPYMKKRVTREEYEKERAHISTIPYNIDIVELGDIRYKESVYSLKKVVQEFLRKMMSLNVNDRPPIEAVLRFFASLLQLINKHVNLGKVHLTQVTLLQAPPAAVEASPALVEDFERLLFLTMWSDYKNEQFTSTLLMQLNQFHLVRELLQQPSAQTFDRSRILQLPNLG